MTILTEIQSLILYFICFLFSIILMKCYEKSILDDSKRNNIKSISLFILVLSIPVILASVRYQTGTDFLNYVYSYYMYADYSMMDIFNSSDPLFGLVYLLAKYLFSNQWGVFFISSLITMVILIKALEQYKFLVSITFSISLFFLQYYGLSYNIVRQMIAIVLVFYCYKFIVENKPLKYTVGILIASQIHLSAIFMLPIIFLKKSKSKVSNNKNVFYYLLIFCSPILLYLVMNLMIKLEISRFISSYSFDITSGGIGFLIWILPTLIPIFLYKKRILTLHPSMNPMFNIILLQVPFSYLGYFSLHAYRLTYYSSIVEIILVPLVIKCINNKYEKVIISGYFIFWYIFRFIFDYYLNGAGEIFPYKFLINGN